MRYALITCINGNYRIESEHGTDLNAAQMAWHAKCRTLEGAPDVITATCMVADENLGTVGSLYENIKHPVEEQTEE